MVVGEKTREALNLNTLALPPSPPVSEIQSQEYTDSTGEPSLRILVILRKDTDLSKVSGKEVGELKATIRQSLLDHGVEKFPYIFIATPEELAAEVQD